MTDDVHRWLQTVASIDVQMLRIRIYLDMGGQKRMSWVWKLVPPVKHKKDIWRISRNKLITLKTNFLEQCVCHFDLIYHKNDCFVIQNQQSKQTNRI